MGQVTETQTNGDKQRVGALVPLDIGGQVVFDKSWHSRVGVEVDAELRIVSREQLLGFLLTATVGEVRRSWTFDISGNVSEQVDLGFGMRLIVSITSWSAVPGQVSFDLSVRVVPPFGMSSVMTVEHVTLILPLADELRQLTATPATAQELTSLTRRARPTSQVRPAFDMTMPTALRNELRRRNIAITPYRMKENPRPDPGGGDGGGGGGGELMSPPESVPAGAYIWGFNFFLSHANIQWANIDTDVAQRVAGIVADLTAEIPVVSIVISALQAYLALEMFIINQIDQNNGGRGVYVSMSWFAIGIFVPTSA